MGEHLLSAQVSADSAYTGLQNAEKFSLWGMKKQGGEEADWTLNSISFLIFHLTNKLDK